MTVIDDPAVAVVVADCLAARSAPRAGVTSRHPGRCDWCDFPADYLARLLDGWNDWAGPRDRGRGTVYGRHDARVFSELPRDEQARRIQAARLAASEPTSTPATEPVHEERAETEDVSAWLS